MQWKWLVLVWALLPQAGRAAPAQFDYYLLALSVAPAFCEDEPRSKQRFAQCRNLSEPAFRAMPLTLHGLWPNRANRQHPEFCDGEGGGTFCRLPALQLPVELRAQLGRAMPAMADCLDRHEWAKHGSCSGLGETDYFTVAAALTERVNRALGSEIARHMGREVSLAALREALAQSDPALKESVTFNCQTPRTPSAAKRRPMLREVRVYFERNPASGAPGHPLTYARAGRAHFNSGCTGNKAYIDTPLD